MEDLRKGERLALLRTASRTAGAIVGGLLRQGSEPLQSDPMPANTIALSNLITLSIYRNLKKELLSDYSSLPASD